MSAVKERQHVDILDRVLYRMRILSWSLGRLVDTWFCVEAIKY